MTNQMTTELQQIKIMITQTVAKREILKQQMKEWYDDKPYEKFTNLKDLIAIDSVLSELDSHYKRLWDISNSSSNISA
jgi:hypothetical protein